MKHLDRNSFIVAFGGNFDGISSNETYGQEIDRLARAILNENNSKYVVAYYVANIFTDDVCKAITDDEKMTTARFMLKYFDMRKQTVSGYKTIGRFVTRTLTVSGYQYNMVASILDNFKPSVIRLMGERLQDVHKVVTFVTERHITPSYTVKDVTSLLDKFVKSDGQDQKSDGNGTHVSTSQDVDGQDQDVDGHGQDVETVAIINAFRLMSDTLGQDSDVIKALGQALIEKGYAIK